MVPPRLATEGPHGYHLQVALSSETSIAPPISQAAVYSFFDAALDVLVPTVAHAWLTAAMETDFPQACSKQLRNAVTGYYTCGQWTTYNHYVALNQAKLEFDAIDLSLGSQSGDATTQLPLFDVPAAATHFTGTWDAGNDGV